MSSVEQSQHTKVLDDVCQLVAGYVHTLRGALADARVRVDGVRAISRQLDISRWLANAIKNLIDTSDPLKQIMDLPAPRGRSTITDAIARMCGDDTVSVGALRRSEELLLEALVDRGITQKSLLTMAAGIRGDEESNRHFEKLYQSAFAASSGIWGVRADAVVRTCVVTPTRGSEECWGAVSVTQVLNLQRLRDGPAVPVCSRSTVVDAPSKVTTFGSLLDPESSLPPLVDAYCSPGIDAGEIFQHPPGSSSLAFGARKATRKGPLDICAADWAETAGSNYIASETDRYGQFGYGVRFPIELLVLELLLPKRAMKWAPPSPIHYGSMLSLDQGLKWTEDMRLPLNPALQIVADPPQLPPAFDRVAANHAAVMKDVVRVRDACFDDFVCHQLVMHHPPLHTSLTLRWHLATRE